MEEQNNLEGTEPTTEKTSLLKKFKNAPKRTKLIAAGVTGALLISGGAGAYAIYQSPDTVIAQAVVSLVTASNPSYEIDLGGNVSGLDGKITIFTYSSDKGTAAELNVNTKVGGQDAAATLNLVADKSGNTYLNLSNFTSLGNLLVQIGYLPSSSIDAATAALTDTWVKLNDTDLGQTTSALGSAGSCLNETKATLIAKDIQENLRNNFFVTSKEELAQEDGNRVFVLTLDAGKLRGFASALKKSNGFAELQKCQPGLEITDSMLESITQENIDQAIAKSGTKVKLYADAMSHNFSKLTVDVKDAASGQELNIVLKSNGSHPEKVVIPAESVSFQELLGSLYSAILGVSS